MDTQAQATAVLQAQAGIFLCLGLVMLFAHYTSRRLKANNGAVWYAISALCGSLGLLLQSGYAVLPPLVSVVLGNSFFLGHVCLLTYGVAMVTQQSARKAACLVGVGSAMLVSGLAWLTWGTPTQPGRVLLSSLAIPVLLVPAITLLLRTPDRVIRPATNLFAAMLIVFDAGLLSRAIHLGVRGHQVTGASWGGTVFIAVEALCFFWIDTLRLSAQLESQAMTDPLTGLLNRRAMDTFARRELARCSRQRQAIAALMIDMDHFKEVNDRHGHAVGDEALLRVSEIIRESVRAVDLAARMGGDEFLILLPDASEVTIRVVASRLHAAIAKIRIAVGEGEGLPVSATIGQTRSLTGDVTLEDLMQHSDKSLYEQKRGSRTMRKVELIPIELLFPSRASGAPPAQHDGQVH